MHLNREPARTRSKTASAHCRRSRERSPWMAPLAMVSALLLGVSATHAIDPARRVISPRVLIVGGGPDLRNNQVAIESNVRYVGRLLPRASTRITLFADGDVNNATVLFDDTIDTHSGEYIFDLALRGGDTSEGSAGHYRKPKLGLKLNGASKKPEIQKAFTQLASDPDDPSRPVMLYFTGHGSRNGSDMENNKYDLWGAREGLTVRELSKEIARLPAETPVNIVMVQCFSGAFGNLIFENGDPQGEPIKRDFAGFFATVKERVAAGCTSAVNEAEYHDFTSYFFAALTGRDRVGRRVSGADYNGDGRVGMDEAYCYTLIHDESIDVPVCTSDVFLRRYVLLKDAELFQAPYSSLLSWASPAQRAALEALSTALNRRGEDRITVSYDKMMRQMTGPPEWRSNFRDATARLDMLRKDAKQVLISRWPELRRSGTDDYKQARKEAIAQLAREAEAGKWKDLLDASDAVDKIDQAGEAQEIAASRNLRYVRLGKSVIISHWLKEHGTPELKARYARLVAAEAGSLLLADDQLSLTPHPPSLNRTLRQQGRGSGLQATYSRGSMGGLESAAHYSSLASKRSEVVREGGREVRSDCCTWDKTPILRSPSVD